jgi:hypothetical protein
VWDKTFGRTETDYCEEGQQTLDGCYIMIGWTWNESGAGNVDVWLIKTDGNGNKIWDKTFGGENDEYGRFGQQTDDGGYIITGEIWSLDFTDWDLLLIKTDGSGNKVWEKTFGGDSMDWGLSVQQTGDGGYIVTGSTYSFGAGDTDVWLIKVGPGGGGKVGLSITGGFGVSAKITNTGTTVATDLAWSIDVTGGVILLSSNHTSGTIDELAVNKTATIHSSRLWGIGPITIKVQVDNAVKDATAFLLGPLVLRVKQQ